MENGIEATQITVFWCVLRRILTKEKQILMKPKPNFLFEKIVFGDPRFHDWDFNDLLIWYHDPKAITLKFKIWVHLVPWVKSYSDGELLTREAWTCSRIDTSETAGYRDVLWVKCSFCNHNVIWITYYNYKLTCFILDRSFELVVQVQNWRLDPYFLTINTYSAEKSATNINSSTTYDNLVDPMGV